MPKPMERYRAVPKGGTIIHQVRHGLSAGTAGHGLGPGPARRALKMSAPTRYDEMQSESRWRLPRQCDHWLAMTGKSSVGISLVQRVAFQFTSHSEPVRRLVWESPPSSRPHSSKRRKYPCFRPVSYIIPSPSEKSQ